MCVFVKEGTSETMDKNETLVEGKILIGRLYMSNILFK
jgi:hypothetical protein